MQIMQLIKIRVVTESTLDNKNNHSLRNELGTNNVLQMQLVGALYLILLYFLRALLSLLLQSLSSLPSANSSVDGSRSELTVKWLHICYYKRFNAVHVVYKHNNIIRHASYVCLRDTHFLSLRLFLRLDVMTYHFIICIIYYYYKRLLGIASFEHLSEFCRLIPVLFMMSGRRRRTM